MSGRLTYYAIAVIDYNLVRAGMLYGLGSHSRLRVSHASPPLLTSTNPLPSLHPSPYQAVAGRLLILRPSASWTPASLTHIYELNIISEHDFHDG